MKQKGKYCPRSSCAISRALESIGDKWSLLILRDLMFTDKRTFGEFQASEEKIASNILADRLAALEFNGLITKVIDPCDGRRSLFLLTEKGVDLLPVIVDLGQWSEKHHSNVTGFDNSLGNTGKSRDKMLASLIEKVKSAHTKCQLLNKTTPVNRLKN